MHLAANIQSQAKRGLLSQEKIPSTLALVKGTLDYKDFGDVDIVIEVGLITSIFSVKLLSISHVISYFFHLERISISMINEQMPLFANAVADVVFCQIVFRCTKLQILPRETLGRYQCTSILTS